MASPQPPALPSRIQALAPEVVNKIAAGEIIIAPVHALKELLENAIDAGSTRVEVTVKDGGLKLLQITDNGSGINKDDLPLLCERFTTSKLKAFEDLRSINTYGFRGEALASISHIAHLTVTTRSAASNGGWKAQYKSGKLVSEPRLVAGNQGTIITVEDLFYNVPARRRSFRSGSEELSKIVDLLERYSVHFVGVTVVCKKAEAKSTVLSVPSTATKTQDRIRVVYGPDVATNCLHIEKDHPALSFKLDGWVSSANYTSKKKTVFLLFINHRSVESTTLKRAIEQTYAVFLPKGSRPFVYLSVEIPPERVDVNVHPTKKEVHFLREDEIINEICSVIRTSLAEVDVSRTFMTQTMLVSAGKAGSWTPGGDASQEQPPPPSSLSLSSNATQTPIRTRSLPASGTPQSFLDVDSPRMNQSPSVRTGSGSSRVATPRNDSVLVRIDHQSQKITSMFSSSRTSTPATRVATRQVEPESEGSEQDEGDSSDDGGDGTENTNSSNSNSDHIAGAIRTRQKYKRCTLTSIRTLRSEAVATANPALTDIFAKHIFIGITDSAARLAVIQSGVRMYVVDYGRVCEQFLYQRGLALFGNFGSITIGRRIGSDGKDVLDADTGHVDENDGQSKVVPGMDLDYMLDEAVKYEYTVRGRDPADRFSDPDVDWDAIKKDVKRTIYDRRAMLKEYFSIHIVVDGESADENDNTNDGDDGLEADPTTAKLLLLTMPILVKNYFPSLAKLPMFLLRLGRDVDWSDEQVCFESFIRLLAKYYTPESLPVETSSSVSSSVSPPNSQQDGDTDARAGADAEMDTDGQPQKDRNIAEPGKSSTAVERRRKQLYESLEKAIFPAIKKRFIATDETGGVGGPAGRTGAVLEIADLKTMYKTFERC